MTRSVYRVQRVSCMPVPDDELIDDLRATATRLGKRTVGLKEYREVGKYDDTTVSRRFGSSNDALRAAGPSVSNEIDISDERLFENILALWQHYGRQPRRAELAKPPSSISQSPYHRRFGSWTTALSAFVEYANEGNVENVVGQKSFVPRRETARDPSLRLRWRVLQRDRFTCRACGATPALIPGVELHVDHIAAWSKGGLTILENLQTLCSRCNLGKSNAPG